MNGFPKSIFRSAGKGGCSLSLQKQKLPAVSPTACVSDVSDQGSITWESRDKMFVPTELTLPMTVPDLSTPCFSFR